MIELTSVVCFPKKSISKKVQANIRKALTRQYTPYGSKKSVTITGYIETDEEMFVPRTYGKHYISRNLSHHGLKLVDHVSDGIPMDVKCKVSPRDYQVSVIDNMVDHLKRFEDLQMKAATGMGKTVMSIITAMRLGVNTLIVVDQDNIFRQWRDDNLLNPDLFGLKKSQVGQVKAGVIDYENKPFVIATIQTITRSEKIPEEFFDYFGMVIFDEAHTTAAASSYQTALFDINARYRLAVTATPRTDAYGKLQAKHLGEVAVTLEKEHKPSDVRYVINESVYSFYANASSMAGRILSEITEDTARNLLCVDIIKRMYDRDRVLLVLGDRVQHLHILAGLCKLAGIPENEIGLYVGDEYVPVTKPMAIEPRTIAGLKSGEDYCPIELEFKKSKVKQAKIDTIKETCSIIFATYKMFDKAVDLPELDSGLDVTPRAKAQQAHGRILRMMDDKLKPLWVTIRDINNFRLEHTFKVRVEEYARSNGELAEWHLEKGIAREEAADLIMSASTNSARLRRLRIESHAQGGHYLKGEGKPKQILRLSTPAGVKSTSRKRHHK